MSGRPRSTADSRTPPVTRVAVITGGNRGLGFETCRQLGRLGYRVILTSRVPAKGRAAAKVLRRDGYDIVFFQLDVTNGASVERIGHFVLSEQGRIDVLVNNAGVYPDEGRSVLGVEVDSFRTVMETNAYGPLALCQAFVPSMIRQRYGRVVNVSSGSGQLSTMVDDTPAYNMSKAALNALTRMVAEAAAGRNVLVNSVCPGWVRTDMGGPRAPRSLEKGVETIVWAATLPDGGPTGGFFRDRTSIPW